MEIAETQQNSLTAGGVPKIAVSAPEAAEMFGVSKSFWDKLSDRGAIPAPRKLGTRNVWDVEELRAWSRHRCPGRIEWQQIYFGDG
jgi:predicted DNA-binding transcriptional regulator AlpA